jgi:hypothetical protein
MGQYGEGEAACRQIKEISKAVIDTEMHSFITGMRLITKLKY